MVPPFLGNSVAKHLWQKLSSSPEWWHKLVGERDKGVTTNLCLTWSTYQDPVSRVEGIRVFECDSLRVIFSRDITGEIDQIYSSHAC